MNRQKIFMIRKWLPGVLAAALLAAAGCDGTGGNGGVYNGGGTTTKFVDSRLRGTWESTDTNLYSGSLLILCVFHKRYGTVSPLHFRRKRRSPQTDGGLGRENGAAAMNPDYMRTVIFGK
jgi:hypothetical protein